MAIVGPTGAGKTTLVNLMMRFYEPDAGRIKLDGVDVTSVQWLMWTAPSGTNRFCPVVLVPSSNKFARHSKRNLV
ncbi:hypothetical protein GCM10009712_14550 [Pseudarthrobacter sulfonivorans]|nr:ATP-binding cassette domain-containing protein [Pseudarthrobacter sulfonivorans]